MKNDEITFLDIGVALYLRKWKIAILTMVIFALSLVSLGLPHKVTLAESMIRLISFNGKFPIEDASVLQYQITNVLLPKVAHGKKVPIEIQAVDLGKMLFKISTPITTLSFSEVKKIHNDLCDEIILQHQKYLKEGSFEGNNSVFIVSPAEKIYIAKTIVVPAWTKSFMMKVFTMLVLSIVISLVVVFSWDSFEKIKDVSKNTKV